MPPKKNLSWNAANQAPSCSSQRIAQPLASKEYEKLSQASLRDACEGRVALQNTNDRTFKKRAQLLVELEEADAKDASFPVDAGIAAPAGRGVGNLATLFLKQSLVARSTASNSQWIAQPLVEQSKMASSSKTKEQAKPKRGANLKASSTWKKREDKFHISRKRKMS